MDKQKIIDLLEDIQIWMLDNDLECDNVGSQLYKDIDNILEEQFGIKF